jgi:hypothetical protein
LALRATTTPAGQGNRGGLLVDAEVVEVEAAGNGWRRDGGLITAVFPAFSWWSRSSPVP